jgi:hypothetical protein
VRKNRASLAVMSATVTLLAACFGGGNEASAPPTASESTVTASTSTAVVTVTATGAETEPTATEPVTVTGLSDVPTTTEVGTDVLPKSAPAWKEEISVCRTRSFQIVYDREIPAVLVLRRDQVLAWAGLYRRDVSDGCRDVRHKPPAPASNESPEGIYESVRVRCTAPGRIQIDAHAIEMSGSVYGSLIYIAVAGTPEWLISAPVVKNVEGRRIYVNDKYCERS